MSTQIDTLLLHPQTAMQIKQYLAKPSHALLILGSSGSGKEFLAGSVVTDLLGLKSPEIFLSYPFLIHLRRPPDKHNISIEMIRELIPKLHLKASGINSRIVLIENSQDLSDEAQNALLKILEEPNQNIFFILTASSKQSVLSTISSRAQQIYVHPVGLPQAKSYFGNKYSAASIENAWLLSRGSLGLLTGLLREGEGHSFKKSVAEAKNLLRKRPYERLQNLNKIARDKEQLIQLIGALNRVIAALHHSSIEKDQIKYSEKMLLNRQVIEQAQNALESNANTRLVILRLSLQLKL